MNVIEVFLPQLLTYPNPTDPLNGEAAASLLRDPQGYQNKVKGTRGAREHNAYGADKAVLVG